MGLSRKLGGGQSEMSRASKQADYAWSTQAYTMREILTRFQLPCVVQCAGDPGAVHWADFRFDMRQPMLLYAARTVRKIHARSLRSRAGNHSCEMEEFGPPLAIPEDYDGWFFPVSRKDPTVLPRHTRVESVAASPCRQFLVSTTLPAFRQVEGTGEKHVPHEVSIGEVLTKVGVQRSEQYLRCIDENQQEVIIPFNHRALLYDKVDNYGSQRRNKRAETREIPGVVHTSTLVRVGNKYLPRIFQHVLGDLPVLTHAFTGILRCYSVFTEETVMAATMCRTNLSSSAEASCCLEMATDSSAKFNIALNANELKRTSPYASAMEICEEQGPRYVRAIKVSFTVHPDMPILDDVDLSLYVDGEESDTSSSTDFKEQDTLQPNVAKFSIGQCSGENADLLDIDDDISVTTDDIDDSVVDTISLSDITDVTGNESFEGISISGNVEVDANAEFDISWGQIKHARSFSGSISTLTDSGTNPSSCASDSEDSLVDDTLDSSFSRVSTLTMDNSSNISVDTVIQRPTAPSPVYANVQQEKLSVFSSSQTDDRLNSSDELLTKHTDASNMLVERKPQCKNTDTEFSDHTVRSVWNITPTNDDKCLSHSCLSGGLMHSSVQHIAYGKDGQESKQTIWWGDCKDSHSKLLLDSDESILQVHSNLLKDNKETNISTPKDYPAHFTIGKRTLSDQLSTGSISSDCSTVVPHPLLSTKSSVQSEGGAQDLAIQRLEAALNEATNFLQGNYHAKMDTAALPNSGMPMLQGTNQSSQYFNSTNRVAQQFSHKSLTKTVTSDIKVLDSTFRKNAQGVSLTNFKPSPKSAATISSTGNHREVLTSQDASFNKATHRREEYNQAECSLAPGQIYHQNDGQVDLEFVKVLGDKLTAVSKKSSAQKYQRLQSDKAIPGSNSLESRNGNYRLQKQKPNTNRGRDIDEQCVSDTVNTVLNQNWNRVDLSQKKAILDELDLLQEEIV